MNETDLIRDDEVFIRMTFPERALHLLLLASFTVLILTGLPLLIVKPAALKSVFAFRGAYAVRAVLHRISAVLLIIDMAGYLSYSAFSARGRDHFRAMRPRRRDFRDAFQQLGYNLGWGMALFRRGRFPGFFERHPFWKFETPPEFGLYNFVEKFEFWSVLWGSGIMILTGFFMWRVNLSLRLFPLWVHDMFVAIHGLEAVLAFLAIIVWHMYSVHLNPDVFPMSRTWLDGKITGKELRTRHALEYRRILEARRKESGLTTGSSK